MSLGPSEEGGGWAKGASGGEGERGRTEEEQRGWGGMHKDTNIENKPKYWLPRW